MEMAETVETNPVHTDSSNLQASSSEPQVINSGPLDSDNELQDHDHEFVHQGHDDHLGHSEPWFYPFLDIIFVAAIKNINALAAECDGYLIMLYVTMASFLALIFSTRLGFDMATHTYECKRFVTLPFIFINIGGMFVMTFFIAVVPNNDFLEEFGAPAWNTGDIGNSFAGCNQSFTNSHGFIAGFLITRISLIILYVLSIRRSKALSAAPKPPTEDIHDILRYHKTPKIPNKEVIAKTVDYIQKGLREKHISKDEVLSFVRGASLGYQVGIKHNDLNIDDRPDDLIRIELGFRVITLTLSSCIVLFGVWHRILESYWLLGAALVEFIGEGAKDRIKHLYVLRFDDTRNDEAHRKKIEDMKKADEAHFKKIAGMFQNRLGLFLLIILGETVLGLAIQPLSTTDTDASNHGIAILISTFVITFILGNQFLTYSTRPHVTEGHALLGRRALYMWMHGIASFALLMASGAIEVLFEKSQHVYAHENVVHDDPSVDDDVYATAGISETEVNRRKLALGLAVAWTCMILMRMMHKETRQDQLGVWGIHFKRVAFFGRSLSVIGHCIGLARFIPTIYLLPYHACICCLPMLVKLTEFLVGPLICHNQHKPKRHKSGVQMSVMQALKDTVLREESNRSLGSMVSAVRPSYIASIREKDYKHEAYLNIPAIERQSSLLWEWIDALSFGLEEKIVAEEKSSDSPLDEAP